MTTCLLPTDAAHITQHSPTATDNHRVGSTAVSAFAKLRSVRFNDNAAADDPKAPRAETAHNLTF